MIQEDNLNVFRWLYKFMQSRPNSRVESAFREIKREKFYYHVT